jgi:hypothetical protein
MKTDKIRAECLKPAISWVQPVGDEVRQVLGLAGLSGGAAASLLGLGKGGGRTVRRWTGDESPIPYAAWALLCHAAGFGQIWIDAKDNLAAKSLANPLDK